MWHNFIKKGCRVPTSTRNFDKAIKVKLSTLVEINS